MRKLFLLLAVLLLASAAYAVDVTISCAQNGDVNEVIVSYVANGDANIPRGFGLDIQLDNDEKITSVTVLDPNYWVYPGTYGDTNDPVGDPCDSSDTLPGIDSNGITIEMGSLHSPTGYDSPNAPEVSNDLLLFTVSGECTVSIQGNAARGKVVLYDATNEDDGRDVVYTGCTVELGCWTGDATSKAAWEAVGAPECWCAAGAPGANPRQCHGDADGLASGKSNYWVAAGDLTILKAAWQKPYSALLAGQICADFDRLPSGKSAYRVAATDLTILKANWQQANLPPADCVDVLGSQEP